MIGAVRLAFILTVLTVLQPSVAAAQEEFDLNIPASPVADAIKSLSFQTGHSVLFQTDEVQETTTNAIEGKMTLREALDALLEGTSLSGGLTGSGIITISLSGNPKSTGLEGKKVASGKIRKSLLASVSAALFSTGAGSVFAQDADPYGTAAQASDDSIVVTGTRLANSNLKSSSSVTVLGAEEIDVRGVLRVEDLLNTLPQALSGQSSTTGVDGAQATVNLRGLGANRTLVLVDGKRLPFGSPINAAADLNQIPSQLVKRVEVLTGGATAVYGSDAVAGVVNFIMERDFEGLEANFQGSFFQAGNNNDNVERILADFNQPDADSITDGRTLDFSLVGGTNFANGRGNVTAYFGYSKDNAVRWEDRDITACPFGTRNGGTDFSCSGSGSMPNVTRFTRTGSDGFDLVVDEETGGLRNFNQSTDAFNFAYGNFLQRPRERFTYGAFTHYDLNDSTEFFLDFSVADNTTDAQIAPSGLTLGRTTTINCDNPLLSADMLATFCNPADVTIDSDGVARAPLNIGRRNLEFPRIAEYSLKTQRVVGGFRGEIFEGVEYELFGQYSKVDYSEILTNDISTSRVTRAIDVVTDPDSGQPVCRAVLTGEDSACIPFDVFALDGITEAGSNYVTMPTLRYGKTGQLVFGGSLTGDLGRWGLVSPFAEEGFQAAIGGEYRRDTLSLTPDSSDTTTSQRTPVEGAINVYEFFAEVQAPLVQGAQLAEELTLTGAYRFSDFYRTTGTQSTYSVGLSWEPVEDIRFRGQYQRATRSPNPIELFSPQDFGRDVLSTQPNGLRDPCAGDFNSGTTMPEPFRSLEECALTGVTAAQYGTILDTADNIPTLAGGNPNLDPEFSNTWTGGVIVQPRFVPGLVLSVDYFNIEVKGFVGSVDPSDALNQCLDTGASNYCELIHRDSAGTLFLVDGEAYIESTLINTGRLKTSGFDLGASYSFALDDLGLADAGDFRLDYVATVLSELEEQALAGEPANECAGLYAGACGNPSPKYRHRAVLGWTKGALGVNFTWRYVSGIDEFSTTPTAVNALEAKSFFDLSLRHNTTDHVQLRAGVNNLFDQDPPLTSLAGFGGGESNGRGNTFPQLYDAQGRYIFAGATVRF